MIIYLVRHGISKANEARLVTGTPEDSLSDEGVAQVFRMSHWLKYIGITADRYVTSQWGRAQQTASLLWPDVDWSIDDRVGETNGGSVASWPLSKFNEYSPYFYDDPANCYPGGESHLDLNVRVLGWLNAELERPCNSLVLVTHSGPISCILQYIYDVPMIKFPAFLPAQGSITAIEFIQDHGVWSGRLIFFSVEATENLSRSLCRLGGHN